MTPEGGPPPDSGGAPVTAPPPSARSASNYRVIEMLTVATVWYLFFVSLLTFGQRILERRLSRGYSR